MDPQLERRLRDEVIYLHSLWHQGPPRPPSTTNAAANPAVRRHPLGPSQTTQFKKKAITAAADYAGSDDESYSSEWPEWSSPERPDPKPPSVSPEEPSKFFSKNAHQNALKVVGEFLGSNDGDDEDEDEDDDESAEAAEYDCPQYYAFFLKVFNEDTELREYYSKNFGNGIFSCLVCGGLGGRKTWKKFKGCLALVQHSITISKTKSRRAHRALGQVVCKVLGWDIDQLPTVASALSDKSPDAEGISTNKNVVDDVGSVEGDKLEDKDERNRAIDGGLVPQGNEGSMLCSVEKNSSTCPDTGKDFDVPLQNVEAPLPEGFTSEAPVEIPGVGNGTREW